MVLDTRRSTLYVSPLDFYDYYFSFSLRRQLGYRVYLIVAVHRVLISSTLFGALLSLHVALDNVDVTVRFSIYLLEDSRLNTILQRLSSSWDDEKLGKRVAVR